MIDIGANLLDDMFTGTYNGKSYHPNDTQSMLQRAQENGVDFIFITAGSLQEAKDCLELAENHRHLFSTVGVHPTRCNVFEEEGDPEEYLSQLKELILEDSGKGNIVAVGEVGLDYARTQFCSVETQKIYFERQFELAETGLPLFLHLRDADDDFIEIISRNRDRFTNGVVHSFDGSIETANRLIELDLYIGINGCSLKTEENLEVVKQIPLERLMIETDAPWCQIRPSHAASKHIQTKFQSKDKKKFVEGTMVKGRNEPACLVQVLEVISALKEVPLEEAKSIIYQNTTKVFNTTKH
eukprot:TRINITY_DN4755_c0_g1_i2.p1 TRINITY_DN4755_c0_g1~~TRINITY_DN4755_c0_g1_i2.p1  ORF type:complete len:349 (+),score=67.14 TRINITY_DN4755_c0_g1_i2:156-1049(+)